MNSIYLDYAAATPVDSRVLAAMQPYYGEAFYNPSATYLAAKRVRQDLDAARAKVAAALGVKPVEVIFTAGGTEANNLAIHGVMRAHPGKKIIVSAIEHESVLAAARQYDCIEAPVRPDGVIDVAALEQIIDDDTVLVSIMYANNEVGTIQPIREIAQIITKKRASRLKSQAAAARLSDFRLSTFDSVTSDLPLYLHTDAAQAANYMDLHVSRLGVDLLTLNGGKIYGPKQTGALWVHSGVNLKPLVYGGGQERGLRSGTENVAGAVGLGVALELAQAMRHEESRRLGALQELFFHLLSEDLPVAIINGSRQKRLPNNVHITIPGADNERLLMALDESGIMAAAGSACSASDEEPSHVLRAMAVSDAHAQSSLRFTLGRSTTEADIRRTVDMLVHLI